MRSAPKRIFLTITNDDDFLSPYWNKVPTLSSEAASILEQKINLFSKRELKGLSIEISSDTISKEEQVFYQKAIQAYFKGRRKSAQIGWRRNLVSAIVLFLIGVLVLLSHTFFQDAVFAEVIDIAGWVFIWQATSQFWLDSYNLWIEASRAKWMEQAPLVFTKLSSKTKWIEEELESKD